MMGFDDSIEITWRYIAKQILDHESSISVNKNLLLAKQERIIYEDIKKNFTYGKSVA